MRIRVSESREHSIDKGEGLHMSASRAVPTGMITDVPAVPPVRRVRHQVRDGLAVMAFSAASSSALALALMLLVRLGK